jgi:hypothetical protein
MNVLAQIRAAAAQEAPSTAPLVSPAPLPHAGPSQPLQAPCPFTFGPWQPHTRGAHPDEAIRPVFHRGQLVAWWAREWVPPEWLHNYHPPMGLDGFTQHSLYRPDGALLNTLCDSQRLLETFAAAIGG